MKTYYSVFEDGTVDQSTEDFGIALDLGLSLETEEEIVYGYDGKRYLQSDCPETPLDLLRAPKLQEIADAFDDEIERTGHITTSLDGFEVDARRKDYQNITGIIEYYQEPITYKGYTEDRPNTTRDELKIIAGEIVRRGNWLYQKKWSLEDAVKNAQTAEEIASISWSADWEAGMGPSTTTEEN